MQRDAWKLARCRHGDGSLVDLFFSDQPADIARAKAMCRGCPLARPCLEGALDRQEPWGVWGGELVVAGRVLAVKRPRGRPRLRPAV
ncbi:MAG TPA: WhiB family transcriptional regulator [Acidimicrobiales bacterium]|nr:WhiB family transcriptional regulator [Acidimicrobiales bacterium]